MEKAIDSVSAADSDKSMSIVFPGIRWSKEFVGQTMIELPEKDNSYSRFHYYICHNTVYMKRVGRPYYWQGEVHLVDGKMVLTKGFIEFVADNAIEIGNLVKFSYKKGMFDITVYSNALH